MAWRLARRGHTVHSYAPIPRSCPKSKWRGTKWKSLEQADFTQPGVWVVFRNVECLDNLPHTEDQQVWLVCQDEVALGVTPERAAKIDKVLAYCQWHKRHLERCLPILKGKIVVTSNGIKTDLIRSIDDTKIIRDNKRLIFASSPDRGLLPLLKIFRKVREFEPEATLHCFYGINNIEKLIKFNKQHSHYADFVAELKQELKQPGVTWHGRVGQKQLYKEFLKSGIWAYPTNFTETSPVHGDTLIETLTGPVPIRDLVGKSDFPVYSCDIAGNVSNSIVKWCGLTRADARVIQLKFRPVRGRNKEYTLTLTPDHEVMLVTGEYRAAGELKVRDRIKAFHKKVEFIAAIVTGIEEAGTADVYCMEVDPDHNFVANGIVVHNCITCMESQALGCVPVFSPKAALAENVMNGVPIEGDRDDPQVQARFVYEITKLMWYPQIQADFRQLLGPQAKARFAWDRQVDQWESWLYGWGNRFYAAQFAFQLKHAEGRILNVGCADDPAQFGLHGALNIDAAKIIPWSKEPTKAHVHHDARKPFPKTLGKFDSIILGDILEHMTDKDAIKILRNCKTLLLPKGRIVITCPEDYRPVEEQHVKKTHKYLKGESAYHERPITKQIINGWLAKAGLKSKLHQVIDYAHFSGHGIIAIRNNNGRS